MKHHYFNSIHETQLPEPIKESFEDEYEMAHLRRIKDTVYLILNYPAETTHRKTICVYSDTDNLYLYAPYDLEPYVENHSDLPDILMGMVSYYEILTRQIHRFSTMRRLWKILWIKVTSALCIYFKKR